MPNSRTISGGILCGFLLLSALTSSFWSMPKTVTSTNERSEVSADSIELNSRASTPPDPLSSTSTYYTVRRDLRRCASPLCGGYFVSRVNQALTRCSNRQSQAQCYVAEIDWNGQPAVDSGDRPSDTKALLRGDLVEKAYQGFGRLGVLRVKESWEAASDNKPTGTYYRVRELGVRCITHPCLTHDEAKLNTTVNRKIAGVDLNATGAPDELLSRAFTEITSSEGIIVTGSDLPVRGPAGRSFTLKASQFYLRLRSSRANQPGKGTDGKGCIRTGCSGIICADEEMMSTCEWKEEYECYKTARCERQSDGKCGFTKTPELTACIASKRG